MKNTTLLSVIALILIKPLDAWSIDDCSDVLQRGQIEETFIHSKSDRQRFLAEAYRLRKGQSKSTSKSAGGSYGAGSADYSSSKGSSSTYDLQNAMNSAEKITEEMMTDMTRVVTETGAQWERCMSRIGARCSLSVTKTSLAIIAQYNASKPADVAKFTVWAVGKGYKPKKRKVKVKDGLSKIVDYNLRTAKKKTAGGSDIDWWPVPVTFYCEADRKQPSANKNGQLAFEYALDEALLESLGTQSIVFEASPKSFVKNPPKCNNGGAAHRVWSVSGIEVLDPSAEKAFTVDLIKFYEKGSRVLSGSEGAIYRQYLTDRYYANYQIQGTYANRWTPKPVFTNISYGSFSTSPASLSWRTLSGPTTGIVRIHGHPAFNEITSCTRGKGRSNRSATGYFLKVNGKDASLSGTNCSYDLNYCDIPYTVK